MANNADTGNGATLTIGTFTGRITRINPTEETRPALENDDLQTTGNRKWAEGDLVDAGEIEIDYIFRSDQDLPPFASPATLTVTFPTFPGKTTAANIAGTAFLVMRKKPELVNNQLQAGSARWRFDGETGPTYTKAS